MSLAIQFYMHNRKHQVKTQRRGFTSMSTNHGTSFPKPHRQWAVLHCGWRRPALSPNVTGHLLISLFYCCGHGAGQQNRRR